MLPYYRRRFSRVHYTHEITLRPLIAFFEFHSSSTTSSSWCPLTPPPPPPRTIIHGWWKKRGKTERSSSERRGKTEKRTIKGIFERENCCTGRDTIHTVFEKTDEEGSEKYKIFDSVRVTVACCSMVVKWWISKNPKNVNISLRLSLSHTQEFILQINLFIIKIKFLSVCSPHSQNSRARPKDWK